MEVGRYYLKSTYMGQLFDTLFLMLIAKYLAHFPLRVVLGVNLVTYPFFSAKSLARAAGFGTFKNQAFLPLM